MLNLFQQASFGLLHVIKQILSKLAQLMLQNHLNPLQCLLFSQMHIKLILVELLSKMNLFKIFQTLSPLFFIYFICYCKVFMLREQGAPMEQHEANYKNNDAIYFAFF